MMRTTILAQSTSLSGLLGRPHRRMRGGEMTVITPPAFESTYEGTCCRRLPEYSRMSRPKDQVTDASCLAQGASDTLMTNCGSRAKLRGPTTPRITILSLPKARPLLQHNSPLSTIKSSFEHTRPQYDGLGPDDGVLLIVNTPRMGPGWVLAIHRAQIAQRPPLHGRAMRLRVERALVATKHRDLPLLTRWTPGPHRSADGRC